MRRVIKTCTWQLLGIVWAAAYALATGSNILEIVLFALASVPAGSAMYYGHEWIWDRFK